MSTPLTDAINALTATANATTGASDTTLSDAVASLIAGYGGGGGGDINFTLDANGDITEVNLGMATIPPYGLNYFMYNNASYPTVKFTTKPTHIGNQAFRGAKVHLDWSGLSELVTVDTDYALAISCESSTASETVSLPKFVGYTDSYPALDIFRMANANEPKIYRLPAMTIIPQFAWYGSRATGLDIVIGAVGSAVTGCKSQPFGGTGNASGTVTIYTNATYLATVKSAVEASAGSNLTFVYKASESTTYNGTSYNAGDTISV